MSAGRQTGAGALLALCAFVAGCADEASPPQAVVPVDVAFLRDWQVWRLQREQELLRPDGWTSLVGLHWIEPGAHYVGSDRRNGIRLAVGPPHLGMIERRGDRLRFVPERGVALTLDGEPLRGEAILRTDADPRGASVIGFDEGKGGARVLQRGHRHALSVWHADAPTRTGFAGLTHWPADPAWRIRANYVTYPQTRTLEIHDLIGNVAHARNPGYVTFRREGREFRLEMVELRELGDTPVLLFADHTNAKGSYSAGRYLRIERKQENEAIVDFNRSYNPPCAFTPYSTCPLPPVTNRLEMAVTAGEKVYASRSKP